MIDELHHFVVFSFVFLATLQYWCIVNFDINFNLIHVDINFALIEYIFFGQIKNEKCITVVTPPFHLSNACMYKYSTSTLNLLVTQ